MADPQPSSNVLVEFDPLAAPTSDPAPSSGGNSLAETPQVTIKGSSGESVPISLQSNILTGDSTAPSPKNDVSATNPPSSTLETTPTTAVTTPQGTTGGAPTSGHVTGTKDTPTGETSSGSKKKKKKKKHSSEKSPKRTQAKSPLRNVGGKAQFSTSEINTEMNQIDQFLQSLKMGTYDPLNPQSALLTAQPSLTATSTPASANIPPVGQVGGAIKGCVATTGGGVTSAAAAAGAVSTSGGGVAATAGMGSGGSLGLKLIGQLESSSSSDSWDSSSDSSDEDSEEETSMVIIEGSDEEEGSGSGQKKIGKYSYPMIKDEIHYRDVPPLESCDIPFPEGAGLMALGKVSHITEEVVVIRALPDTPPVDEGTVLWSQEKKSLSVIFEIFGPVKAPYYSVHVKSPEHAQTLGLEPGRVVYVIPGNEELTKYVFTQKLLQERGSDASWRDDAEVPEEYQDFSDDEAEKQKNRSKRAGKHQGKATPTQDSPSHAQKKQRAPRYSGDPKMRAYFPGARAPLPPTSTGGMGGPPPGPHGYPPGNYGGGMPYYTPRGFMGYLPPGMAPQQPPFQPPHHPVPPQGGYGYPMPPGGVQPQAPLPPQNLPPQPLMYPQNQYYPRPPNH